MAAAASSKVDENLAAAEALRSEGLALYHAGDIPQAMFRWHSMLLHLQGIDRSASSALSHANGGGGGSGGQSSLSPPQQAAVRELLIAAHSNLSLGLLKREKFERALEEVSKALSFGPSNVKALLRRARVYVALRDADKAEADLRRVLELEPGNSDALGIVAGDLRSLKAADTITQTALARKMFASSLG